MSIAMSAEPSGAEPRVPRSEDVQLGNSGCGISANGAPPRRFELKPVFAPLSPVVCVRVLTVTDELLEEMGKPMETSPANLRSIVESGWAGPIGLAAGLAPVLGAVVAALNPSEL
jgi:hypothetical protein